MTASPPRLGFFGGSFDPVHLGHLELARLAVEKARLQRLYFIPAARNPLKATGPLASGERRVEMICAAIEAEPRLGLIDWELKQPPPSYSRRTVSYLRDRFSGTELYWLIGADQLPGLPQWCEIERLVSEITFLVFARPGSTGDLPAIPGLRVQWIETPEYDLSSTEIRHRLAAGLSIDNLVSLPVLKILRKHPQLYRPR